MTYIGPRMLRVWAVLFLAASAAHASFEKGGLLGSGGRSAALGGASIALADDLATARSNPAGLSQMQGAHLFGSREAASRTKDVTTFFGAATMIEGIGVSVLASDTSFKVGNERQYAVAAGIPFEEVPWISFGAAIKMLSSNLGVDKADGFGLDGAIMARPSLPWYGAELRMALAVEDALGSISWNDGFSEELKRQVRFGLGVRVGRSLYVLSEFISAEERAGRETITAFGIEQTYELSRIPLSLRGGWRDGDRRDPIFTTGLGVKIGSASLDYAMTGQTESQGVLNLFSIKWNFGGGLFQIAGQLPRSLEVWVRPDREIIEVTSPYESMTFAVRYPKAEQISSWAVLLIDKCGEVVWNVEGSGIPPELLTWNGTTIEGAFVPTGSYTCHLLVRGPGAYRYLSKGTGFKVKRAPEPGDTETPGGF